MAIKKALQPLHTALTELPAETTLGEALANTAIVKLFEAGRGGFSGEDSFVTIDGVKVARICAMTGGVFAHDNNDKATSFFYKNGSYVIPAEVMKATARKEWEANIAKELEDLTDIMVAGEISPTEWQEQTAVIKAKEFEYHMDDDTKAQIISDYDGYATKEDFEADYPDTPRFEDYAEKVQALRDLSKKEEEA